MRYILCFLVFTFIVSCKDPKTREAREPISKSETIETISSNESSDLSAISTKDFREFKVLDSNHITKEKIWAEINPQMEVFTEADYLRLKPFILEKGIHQLQAYRIEGKFTYEELTKFYLYRIRKFDRENDFSLNSVISINPNVIKEAKQSDLDFRNRMEKHPVFGMPILLKDNINTSGMATTAGAVALKDNITEDAFMVKQLKSKGALILGKANLSEWAYFFCGDCPSGYSAIGGQTLNPYGRRIIDTGGSSSGSAVAVAANFCVAAIGSETAGSILSPSSQNSVVGLKPTIGLVSRSGIVPISSTLDTAGPITRFVIDNAIVLSAIYGYDKTDFKSKYINVQDANYLINPNVKYNLQNKRFGAPKRLLEDTLFVKALNILKQQGAEIVEIEEEQVELPNFIKLLNLDMKRDLPVYMENYASKNISLRTVSDVMTFNLKDSLKTMPYGQNLFKGIVEDNGNSDYLERVKNNLKANGKQYFDIPMKAHNLDGFLSINNYHAAFAAVAEYPAITVPMGYANKGEPKGLTFIAKRLQEKNLLKWAFIFEGASRARVAPKDYN
ncbi:amidase family protein [Winogradskyella sp.]|uniref:amidase family protein n=1 Tax=Winogradskyella sp. TaxID=1883156 RepID=UPI0025D5AFBD|nr:amidase family protein [Winogradskyella sp.]MCT4629526.1 amidase family protein [Winogradskyella sp.]